MDGGRTGTGGEGLKWELCPFPGCLQMATGEGTLDGHARETIDMSAGPVAVHARLVRRMTFWALSGRVIAVTVHLALELLVTSGRETV